MAEPNNTPIPASTPRSGSPLPHQHHRSLHSFSFTPVSPSSLTHSAFLPKSTPQQQQQTILLLSSSSATISSELSTYFEVIQGPTCREDLLRGLERRTWGQFHAVWDDREEGEGWDEELVRELPGSVLYFVGKGGSVDTKLLEQGGITFVELTDGQGDAVAGIKEAMGKVSVRDRGERE